MPKFPEEMKYSVSTVWFWTAWNRWCRHSVLNALGRQIANRSSHDKPVTYKNCSHYFCCVFLLLWNKTSCFLLFFPHEGWCCLALCCIRRALLNASFSGVAQPALIGGCCLLYGSVTRGGWSHAVPWVSAAICRAMRGYPYLQNWFLLWPLNWRMPGETRGLIGWKNMNSLSLCRRNLKPFKQLL